MKNQFLFTLLVLLFFGTSQSLLAQTLEFSMVPDSVSTIEIDHTRVLIKDSDQSFLSGNFNFQYKQVINDKFNVIGEFSYLHLKTGFSDADNGLSNVYLGMQYKPNTSDYVYSALNVGVYIPTASEEVQFGSLFNLFDLLKFADRAMGASLGYNHFILYDNGFRFGFELASDILIPTEDSFQDTEIFGKYGISLLYQSTSGIYVQSELLGLANITNENDSFDESTIHSYSAGAGYNGESFGAGLYYRNYFDENIFSNNFKGILGLEINVFL